MNDEDDEEQLFQTVKTNFLKTLQPAHKERTKQIIEGAVQGLGKVPDSKQPTSFGYRV